MWAEHISFFLFLTFLVLAHFGSSFSSCDLMLAASSSWATYFSFIVSKKKKKKSILHSWAIKESPSLLHNVVGHVWILALPRAWGLASHRRQTELTLFQVPCFEGPNSLRFPWSGLFQRFLTAPTLTSLFHFSKVWMSF